LEGNVLWGVPRKKGKKMKANLLKAALAATMVALTTAGASAAGIGIQIGPGYRVHHPLYLHHHRVCHWDRFGYRHCFWR